jgi:hypothetical protein
LNGAVLKINEVPPASAAAAAAAAAAGGGGNQRHGRSEGGRKEERERRQLQQVRGVQGKFKVWTELQFEHCQKRFGYWGPFLKYFFQIFLPDFWQAKGGERPPKNEITKHSVPWRL